MHRHQWNKLAEDVNFNLEIDIDRFRQSISYDSKVLDFGCGYGRIARLLWDSGYRNIVGVDSSVKMIERGLREFPELDLVVLEGESLPFPDNNFDAIIACAVFTCITSREIREHQIKELYRVLKPGGLLHMVEFCSQPGKSFTAGIGVPMLHSTPKELKELAGILQVVSEEVVKTNTMGGNIADSYSLFAKKSQVTSDK